jgi:hypothetical protein
VSLAASALISGDEVHGSLASPPVDAEDVPQPLPNSDQMLSNLGTERSKRLKVLVNESRQTLMVRICARQHPKLHAKVHD